MSLLVHIPSRRELSGEREANGFRRKEQRGRYGLHRRYQSRDHNQLFAAFDVLFRIKYEPETAPAQVFDFSQPGNKAVRHISGIHHPARVQIVQSSHGFPQEQGAMVRSAMTLASHAPAIPTASRRDGFRSVNGRKAIGADTSGARKHTARAT